MLRKLLYREWILNRANVALIFAIFLGFQVYIISSISSTRPFVVMATLYAAFLAAALFVREDKFRSTWWACTLPVTRHELIRARYIASWSMTLAAMAVWVLLVAIIPGSNVLVSEIFDPWTLLIAATLATAIFLWVLPFTIRFGMFGLMVFLIGAQLAGAGLLILGQMLRRGGEAGRSGPGPIRTALGAIGDGILAAREALTPGLFAAAVVALLIVVNWLSYRFAAFLFRRREF